MSKKKSVIKKSFKKKIVKKNVKKKVIKKNVNKRVVKKKVAKAITKMPRLKIFSEMIAAIALLMNKVESLTEECTKIINKTPLIKNSIDTSGLDQELGSVQSVNKQAELFPTDDATIQDSEFTKENVTQALQKVSASVGMPKVKEVLKKFKAERVSDIQETDYKAFIGECDTLISTQA